MDNLDKLLTFFGEPFPFGKRVTDNMSDEFKSRLENLAGTQLSIIELLRSEGLSDNEIRLQVLGVDHFVKNVERMIWSKP